MDLSYILFVVVSSLVAAYLGRRGLKDVMPSPATPSDPDEGPLLDALRELLRSRKVNAARDRLKEALKD